MKRIVFAALFAATSAGSVAPATAFAVSSSGCTGHGSWWSDFWASFNLNMQGNQNTGYLCDGTHL